MDNNLLDRTLAALIKKGDNHEERITWLEKRIDDCVEREKLIPRLNIIKETEVQSMRRIEDLEKRLNALEANLTGGNNGSAIVADDSLEERIRKIEHQNDLLAKLQNSSIPKYKIYSPEDVVELKKKMSWSQLSNYLGCSVTSCQRIVKRANKKEEA